MFVFSWAWLGTIFAYFVLPTPPPSAGAGLGNRATHLWHRTRFHSCGLDMVVLGVFHIILFSFFIFTFRFSMHLPRPPSPPMRVIWQWLSLMISSCPLRPGLPSIFFTYFAEFVASRSEVWESKPHLRFMFYLVRGIGVSMNFS